MESIPTTCFANVPAPRIGVGFRSPHIKDIISTKPELDFFELLTDNHLAEGGYAREQAFAIREYFPVTMHCVGMSLGGTDEIDFNYLSKVKQLAKQLQPELISDHLCWTSFDKQHAHDLLPLPYTDEVVEHVSNRIRIIQDFLETTLVVENVSSYLSYSFSEMQEWEFLSSVAEYADCQILLDINNIYVSQENNRIDAFEYIRNIPIDRIAEIHLAGFENKKDYLLDAHNNPVSLPVWKLYQFFLKQTHQVPTLVEWDNDLPEFNILLQEAEKARAYQQKYSQGYDEIKHPSQLHV